MSTVETAGPVAQSRYTRLQIWTWITVWSLVEALPSLVSGACIALAVDRGFLAGRTLLGLGLLGLLGAVQLLAGLATRAVFRWLPELVEPLRDRMVRLVVASTIRSAVAGQPADLAAVARLTAQAESVRGLSSALLRALRQTAITVVAALVGLAWLDPAVALPATGCVVAATVVYLVLIRRTVQARQRDALLATERLADEAGLVFAGIRDVAAGGAQQRAIAGLNQAIDAQARATLRAARAVAGRTAVVALGGYLPLLVALVVMPGQVRSGQMSVGDAVGAAAYLVTRLLPAVGMLSGTVGIWLVQLSVARHRLREVAAAAPPPDQQAGRVTALPAPDRSRGLELREVTFRYAPRSASVLHRLTLSVPPDGHLVVVGPSGVGKSTLTRVITGELSAQSGSVRWAGAPVGTAGSQRPREIALVPQEAYVFGGTLRENLCYLYPEATDEALAEACRATGLDATVRALGGYDAEVATADGVLTAGARQLIALTRVYLSPADIVILDEATSHLDLAQEELVEAAFVRRPGVLVVVAHRLASARRARQVLLLDGPDWVTGTHSEVAAASPLYAAMLRAWDESPAPATG